MSTSTSPTTGTTPATIAETNLAALLESTARRHPERTAIVFGATRMSYAQVDAAANQVAAMLVGAGIGPGDTVAMTMPNMPQFSVVYFGILKVGATVVPLNILLKAREIEYHLRDSGARAYIAFGGTSELPTGAAAAAAVDALGDVQLITVDSAGSPPWAEFSDEFGCAPVHPDDTAVILYTSGTTGKPKGAELRHRNMRQNALSAPAIFGYRDDAPDTILCVLPLFHSMAQTTLQNAGFAFGATIVMLPRFDPRSAIDAMIAEKVTVFAGVPTVYWALLGSLTESDATALDGTVRIAISGGASLPGEIHREFKDRVGTSILEGYGLSETCPIASFTPVGTEPRVGSVGKPIDGVEMRLIDADWNTVEGTDAIGEVAIRGHNVMKGYHNRAEATAEVLRDGWFRTGDLARKDADGFFYIVDRVKDMIIRGGFNVYPREIEELLMEHPAVSLVAVIGVPHPSHGEEVKAVVVLNPGSDLTETELVDWSKERLAAYKYPRIVEFVDSLPMTATGKILKREIRS